MLTSTGTFSIPLSVNQKYLMKRIYTRLTLYLIVCLCFFSKSIVGQTFIKVKNGHFMNGTRAYYYIGANVWYAPMLAASSRGNKRMIRELDLLKANGVTNLRILVGADGPARANKVAPSLQTAPGIYNDSLLAGLDHLLAEMQRRNMKAVLYLTNSWEWSGGYSQYLEWSGHGKAPVPALDGWNTFTKYAAQFVDCDSCKILFQKHIAHILNRTNRYTHRSYKNDPAIMAWQIANEPRAFSDSGKVSFAKWVVETARYIKSIDSNHLVSTGSEGQSGSEGDLKLYETIHAEPAIDYLTIHIWPNNWGWLNKADLPSSIGTAITNTGMYLDRHLEIARRLKKPLVLEEFGFPRDSLKYSPASSTSLRDRYYNSVFRLVTQSARAHDVLAGCNFWAWAGSGRATPGHVFWEKGDMYLGDPAQEEQGLNSVFNTDATLQLIKESNSLLTN